MYLLKLMCSHHSKKGFLYEIPLFPFIGLFTTLQKSWNRINYVAVYLSDWRINPQTRASPLNLIAICYTKDTIKGYLMRLKFASCLDQTIYLNNLLIIYLYFTLLRKRLIVYIFWLIKRIWPIGSSLCLYSCRPY